MSMRYVALGDSITASRSGVKGYVERLMEDKTELGLSNIQNSGVGGWRTSNLLQNLEQKCLVYQPHIVTMMLGTNDHAIYKGQEGPAVPPEQYEENITEIVRIIRTGGDGEGGQPYVVLMTPPFVATYTNSSGTRVSQSRLERYVDIVKRLAGKLGTGIVDVNAITGEAANHDDRMYCDLYTDRNDGMHLNSAGHQLIVPNLKAEMLKRMDV